MAATVNRRRVVKMSVVDDDGEIEDAGGSQVDFFDHEPTKQEKMEVRLFLHHDGTLEAVRP